MITESLSPQDFIKDILPSELRCRTNGKPIQVVSDFDETQSSTYIFSTKWNTHVPKIRSDLSKEAKKLTYPMCLASARGSNEPVSWVMWHKLSRLPMPLVAENGAVLIWPSDIINQSAQIEVLASDKQVETIRQIQKELQDSLIDSLKVPTGHEIVLRSGRVATVEIRAQNISTKKGTPNDYSSLIEQLQELFPEALSQFEISNSGNSLGIQPMGVSKESGIRAALFRSGVEIDDIFLLGMGDNTNDEPLFNFVRQNGGLTIGVRPNVDNGICNFVFDGGEIISLEVLKVINSL
jgi:hydroxymethylpyrimidine pyrophosphatase-like HAD family hydrolase